MFLRLYKYIAKRLQCLAKMLTATLHSVNEVQYTMNLKLKRAAYRPNFYQCHLKVNVKSGITGTCL